MVLPHEITALLRVDGGFCYPDWNAIAGIIERQIPEQDWKSAWEAASRAWVGALGRCLAGRYRVHESANFLILSAAPDRIAQDVVDSCERALQQILANLEGVASDEGFGKHVMLMFADVDAYYDYITHFHPDGEHPMSGGVCLSGDGYVHFAFSAPEHTSYRSVLVHELTHGCLAHRPLPTWLNEALAIRMEQLICGSGHFEIDPDLCDRHFNFWNQEKIQEFWTGQTWRMPGDPFELSYTLAVILWRKLQVDLPASRDQLLEFAARADYRDAGESACRDVLGVSLGTVMAGFLGDGNWAPDPRSWPPFPEPGSPADRAATPG